MQNESTYRTFTIEEEIIHHLMLQTASIKRNGLLYGKLGIALAFFECSKEWNNPIYDNFAKELKNTIYKKIDNNSPLDFATGLCGVGWGIEYLMEHQLTETDKEVCATIDHKIMMLNMQKITNFSLENGLEGYLHYILIRIKGSIMRKSYNPFDESYLTDIYSRLQFIGETNISSSLKHALISYMNTGLLIYNPNVAMFANSIEIKNIDDVLFAKLGLANGLAGKLLYIINEQKIFQS